MTSDDNIIARTIRLIHYYPRSIYWVLSRLLLLTLAFSVTILLVNPSFEAASRVTTLPSAFELQYTEGRIDIASAFGPAMVLSQTHTEYLLSRTIAEEVAEQLMREGVDPDNGGPVKHRVINPVSRFVRNLVGLANYGRWEPTSPWDAFVNRVQKAITVDNVPGSFILEIRVTWSKPETAARIANLVTEAYIARTLSDNQEEMRVTRQFIDRDVQRTTDELNAVEKRIEEFKRSRNFYIGEHDVRLKLNRMNDLSASFDKIRADIDQLDKKYDVLDEYAEPSALVSLAAEIAGLDARRRIVERSLDREKARLDGYPSSERLLMSMHRARMEKQQRLATLYSSLVKAKIAEASQISSVKIIDPAQIPVFPARPRVLTNCLIALLVGVVLSAGHISFAEHLSQSVRMRGDFGEDRKQLVGLIPYNPPWLRTPDDAEPERRSWLERLLGREVPVLERFIWDLSEYASHLGPTDSSQPKAVSRAAKQQSIFNRHVDHLLEGLIDAGEKGKLVMFTSTYGDKGKSYIIEHLARRAGYAGKRLLLIDGSTAKPKMHDLFGKPLTKGLTNLIAGEKDLNVSGTIVPIDDHIDMICAGTTHLDSRENWLVGRVQSQLDAIRPNYDLILMDTSSLKTDPLVKRIWGLSDELVCVVDAATCTQSDLESLRDRTMDYPNRVSFILNNVKYRRDYLYDS